MGKTSLPKYLPEVDGLRAAAVVAVLLFHLELRGFSLGWAGVQLFFVLSGFLITGILLDAKGKRGYFRTFYVRRALRIFPIYYLSLGGVIGLALIQGRRLDDLPYYLTYAQNYLLGATDFSPRFPLMFNHTWSLAIEEQFYLLWPMAVLWLGRRKLTILLVVLAGLAPVSRALILATTQSATLMDTALPGQVDSLAIGAGLAVLARSGVSRTAITRRAIIVLLASGAALLLLVHANTPAAFWHPSAWATQLRNLPIMSLIAVFWGSLAAIVVFGSTPLSPLLRLGVVRGIGKISYGIYMYHFPSYFVVDKVIMPALPHSGPLSSGQTDAVLKLLLTLLAALVSWHFLESRLLGLKERFVDGG